jgi:hypothetical protein
MSKLATRKKPHVLYFTPESGLTEEQQRELDAIPGARHRNAALVDSEQPLEKGVTGVAGPAVPDQYKKFPYVEADLSDVEEEEEEEAPEGQDFEAMSVPELKAALKAGGVEFPATAKKAALVALAQQNLTEEEEEEEEQE